MIRSFRLRITVWYVLFFSVLLSVFSLLLYGALSRSLRSRLDDTLVAEVRTGVALFQSEMREMGGNAAVAAAESVEEMRTGGILVAIFLDGRLLAASEPGSAAALQQRLPPASSMTDVEVRLTFAGSAPHPSRAVVHRTSAGGRTFLVTVSASLDSVSEELEVVRRVLWVALPLFLLMGAGGGFLLADRSVRPLARMAAQAREITAHNLHKRLKAGGSAEELSTLAATFNELLSRLDASFDTMRRFIADASHEMRTPLAVVRGEADVALSQERSGAEYKESLAVILDESKRLTRLVDDLLNLARADAGSAKLHVEEVYLNDLLSECCRSVQTLAAAKGIALECHDGDDIPCRGDENLLRRLAMNLLENAIRYTPEGGRVEARLAADENLVRISIIDNGIGIPPEAMPHLFERFYRADGPRSRRDGGFGLGLAIVKWIAEAHNGRVQVTSQPGAGSTFTVEFPR